MNSRERVLTTISRHQPDRVPTYLWLTPHLIERLEKERGADDYEEYLKMDIRFVKYSAVPEDNDFSVYSGIMTEPYMFLAFRFVSIIAVVLEPANVRYHIQGCCSLFDEILRFSGFR